MSDTFYIRLAVETDIPALEILIPLSVRALHAPYYSKEQMDASIGPVFGLDRRLISDGSYFVVENSGRMIVGCGGWSRRLATSGGDRDRPGEDKFIDPQRDPARIRAFFVHPDWARRGIGRMLLQESERAIMRAGFRDAILVATLAGEPLYASFGYTVEERYELPTPAGITLTGVRMSKRLVV